MNKKKILLDRFTQSSLSYFCEDFLKLDFDIKIITYINKLETGLKNYSGELLSDSDISRGLFLSEVPWVLSSNDLEFLSQHEGVFHEILSRYTLSVSNWASHEISTHVFSLFNYWKFKLINKKIEVCFAFTAPHDPSSFSLYVVTKLLKIPYIFIDFPIIGQKIRFMSCSYKYRNLLIHNKDNKTPDWAKKILDNHQRDINSDFMNSVPPHNTIKSKPTINKILSAIKRGNLLKQIFNLLFPSAGKYFKFNRLEWYSDKAIPNKIIFLFKLYKITRSISRKESDYKKICTPFKKNLIKTCYIYFSAPLSPEGSNIPASLWNRHIKISILKLVNIVPDNWKIVYKANPNQFNRNKKFMASTYPDWFSSNFYNDLSKNNKISFVSTDTPAKDLIDNSMGVASINGSVSIEAIALGKHAIIFSPMWYEEYEGIHLCKNNKDLKKAIDLMKEKDIPKPILSKIHLSCKSVFDGENFIPNDFSKKVYSTISKKFISSYRVFNEIDEKKWSI
jgi:hypothetical protein